MIGLFEELLQVSLGTRNFLSQEPSAEVWERLFSESLDNMTPMEYREMREEKDKKIDITV